MVYLLDANVLMTANGTYYGIDVVPEFWDWLLDRAKAGHIKMPRETFDEILDGSTDQEKDHLYAWVNRPDVKKALLLNEEVAPILVRRVINEGYAADLNDAELEAIGQDPFLVAHALAAAAGRIVVTTEVSKPKKTRQNRRVPDVCHHFGVQCCDTIAMIRQLGFRTGWKPQVGP